MNSRSAVRRILRLCVPALILSAAMVQPCAGQSSVSPGQKVSLLFEVGNWQPQTLNEQPQFSTFGKAGATPRFGGGVCIPLGKEVGLRLAGGFWSLRDLTKEEEPVHSLALHSVSLDFKYWLVPDFRLSAYVLYGGGVYWGVENNAEPFGRKLRTARPGWGANLGAGFDFAFSRRIGAGMAFQYRFVRFKEPLGGFDDFSGPEIGAVLYYFL